MGEVDVVVARRHVPRTARAVFEGSVSSRQRRSKPAASPEDSGDEVEVVLVTDDEILPKTTKRPQCRDDRLKESWLGAQEALDGALVSIRDHDPIVTLQGVKLGAGRLLMLVVRDSTTLRTLCLGGNELGLAGSVQLAGALKQNRSLRALAVWDNRLRNDGAAVLAAALSHNSTLKSFDVTRNGIGNRGAMEFALALEKNTSLRTLNLSSNQIMKTGAERLAEVLARPNRTLVALNLWGNHCAEEFLRRISRSLRRNRNIRKSHPSPETQRANRRVCTNSFAPSQQRGLRASRRSTPRISHFMECVAEVRMQTLDGLQIVDLVRLSCTCRTNFEEFGHSQDRLRRLCKSLSFAHFKRSFLACLETTSQSTAYNLRARRPCGHRAKEDVGRRFLQLLQVPTLMPFIRRVDLSDAPVDLVRSQDLWQTLERLDLQKVMYPTTGWGSTSELSRFEDMLSYILGRRRHVAGREASSSCSRFGFLGTLSMGEGSGRGV